MRWTALTTSGVGPCARGGHSATVIGESVYVLGGCSFRSSTTDLAIHSNEVYVLDLRSLAWSTPATGGGAAMAPRYAHTATQVPATRNLCVFGGYNPKDGYLGDVWILSTASMTWYAPAVKGQAPAPRYAHSATVIGNLIYVFGGCAEAMCFRDIWTLDTAKMEWSKVHTKGGTPPAPRAYHAAAAVGSSLLVFGGRAGNQYFNDLFMFDTATLVWTRVDHRGAVPPEVAYPTATVVNDKLLLFGGMDGRVCFGSLHCLSLSTMTWEKVVAEGEAPSARHKHASCSFGQCSLVVGGMGYPPLSFGDAYVLDYGASPPAAAAPASTAPEPAASSPAAAATMMSRNSSPPFQPPAKRAAISPSPPVLPTVQKPVSADFVADARVRRLQQECDELKADLAKCMREVDSLSGSQLEGMSYAELEAAEAAHYEALKRISAAKRDLMEQAIRKARDEARAALDGQQPMQADAGAKSRPSQSPPPASAASGELQRRLEEIQKAGVSEDMEVVPKAVGVGWGTVETVEFETAHSVSSVPSAGVAPVGLGERQVCVTKERVEGYERRREPERKGVSRIPEEQRREILMRAGVPDSVIEEESRVIDRIAKSRLESLSSPTENPLPAARLGDAALLEALARLGAGDDRNALAALGVPAPSDAWPPAGPLDLSGVAEGHALAAACAALDAFVTENFTGPVTSGAARR
eukprot:m51a1_g6241 hypothetical protein (695) ;mRNA; f:10946-14108